MKKGKTKLLRVFDNVNLMADAVDSLIEDFKEDIVDFAYLQVRVDTDVNLSLNGTSMRHIARMMQSDIPHRRRLADKDAINRNDNRNDGKNILHALDLKVKGKSFDQIDNVLWSAGGFQSHKPSSWFRVRAKQNVQFVWDSEQFFRILKRTTRRI